MSRAETKPTRVISNRTTVAQRVVEIWRYRELLVGLVRKELKVKYKNSALGFFWSMLNPALYLGVFYLVFQLVLKNGIPYFAIYLLSGLLVWNLFSTALAAATGSVVGNAAIVKKVSFPREILALAAVGASLVHFFLQACVLLAALIGFQYAPSPTFMLLIPVALVALLLLAAALGVLLAAVNVYARDTQHLLELVLLAWFWMTPIVYQYRLVADRLDARGWPEWLMLLNPVVAITTSFQRAIYGTVSAGELDILPPYDQWWYLRNLALVGAFAVVLFVISIHVFDRLQGNFAEEL